MDAYAFATTVLTTSFYEGHRPATLEKVDESMLSASAKETVQWVKEAYESDNIHPIDPNLLLSTDDTTIFVFEGVQGGSEEWEWKIVDRSKTDASVQSDFEVGNDAENSTSCPN